MGYGNTVELELHCHAMTEKAFRFSTDGDDSHGEWVPKGTVKSLHADIERGKVSVVTMYEDMAIEKGFC